MKAKSKLLILFVVFIFIGEINAQQIQMPQASPAAKISQKVGLTDVTVEYSRPSMRGRKIFGELVPYGDVWRTGANAATILTFSTEVKIEGNNVSPGSYALYSIPGKTEWTMILSSNTKLWGAVGYSDADDVLRFKVKPGKTGQKYETMEINFVDITDTGSTLALKWENTRVKFRIETEVDDIVMEQIKELVIDQQPQNPGLYYQAANYYFTNNKDMDQAYEWITKSVNDDPKYWTMHLKAKIELSLGKKKEAIESATKSIEMAKEAKNPDYVGLNERLIKSIK
jgi:hypoxanthine phosphoribosyltransferase